MKKLFTILALSLLCACCAVGFAACEDDNGKITIPDTPHTHEYTETVEPPTCTTDGYTMHVCACKKWYKDNETAALGHNYEWTTTKQPTETEEGVKTGVCTRCGDTITQSIPASNHEHNYIITVVPATCTAGGYTAHKCACGNEYTDNETPALGHNYEWITTKQPTCTEKGEKTATCTRCPETKMEEIEKLEHDYQTEITPPSCSEQGYTTYTCTKCGDSNKNNYTSALGHDFGEWIITTEPTCTTAGEKTRYCSRDNTHTETTPTSALGHNYVDGVCSVCGIQPTSDEYFIFTLLEDDTYEIRFTEPGLLIYDRDLPTVINLPSVYNGKSVTSIGDEAFNGCGNLTSITIPNTHVICLGNYVAKRLKNIDIKKI